MCSIKIAIQYFMPTNCGFPLDAIKLGKKENMIL